ncbi:MAG: exodeoxyribonuclease VII small subunit [Lachnospiraceae bacterium]|nr:exodeoxyribonuclease VII small subunit [Lachnospiraceae bacterium]MBQ9643668.1 exodeoxyribonuclease VII small subunit [Lachnospiraceae bacterium]
MSIEASLEEIQQLLNDMSQDGITLEESFACYEKGIRLLRQVNERIDRVEKKVQMLTEDGTLEAFE